VCACLLMRAPGRGQDGADAVRPYTPISDNAVRGKFELLVKRYPDGAASQWLHSLPLGSSVDFKHIKFNVKEQYPFPGKQTITMIAGGTGIVRDPTASSHGATLFPGLPAALPATCPPC
jgi:cytochrome-b5 reductase